ncbi:sodium:alanine symporter family protein [candidate division KSB1 bacterium]|nr:sodium:alanine symporter family protein [candidate division KSB1 bacterium]
MSSDYFELKAARLKLWEVDLLDQLESILKAFSDILWGPPMLILLVGTGIFLTIRLRGIQFRALWYSLYLALIKRKEDEASEGDITHFQALMTALAATVGTGNIVGVATALTLGGPGALFWMWITGLFGMATKFSEAVLAVKYREIDEYGTMCGGPMYYISKGLGWRWMGILFAIFAALSAFGIGNMVQSNSVADAVEKTFAFPPYATGIVLSIFTALVILGGIKSIGKATSVIVPFMIIFYMLAATVVLIINFRAIPDVFMLVITKAFSSTAAVGGFAGSLMRHGVRWGVARGVFSNESGLGSAPIAAAAAQTKNPVSQALVSMTQTFIDTIVVCSFTGFVIISSGKWIHGETGAKLTTISFNHTVPFDIFGVPLGGLIVTVGLIFFAYSTILGWCYYGEKSVEFLLGPASVKPYRLIFCIFVFIGTILNLNLVWTLADVMNALMAIPNLIALLALSGVVLLEVRKYYYYDYNPLDDETLIRQNRRS